MCEKRVPAQYPVFGLRVVNRDCLTPQGFSPERLDTVYAELASSAHGFDMLMESASFGEVDSYYNPGEEEVSPDFILEAIVVDRFSQTERRMSAVVRIFNRFLSGSEIKALLPVVGKPRKTGAYAYVTVQIPFSDGQTVSVVFHSPEGDKKKIAANDTIIAFQWLLNRRDITHVVAPESGAEISLDELSKKITQLVVKNSTRFERMQKDAAEERKLLDDTRKAVEDAEGKQRDLMSAIASASSESDTVEAKLSNTLSLLEKQKGINTELQAKLEALEKARSAGGGTGTDDGVAKFNVMVAEAARWRGAVMKVAGIVKDDKRTAMAVMKMTTKGDLDAYLMKKFGIDSVTARSVSNELTDKNIPNDMTAEISDYAGEDWAKFALKQTISVILELPVTATRPEEMRVVLENEKYLVQTRRDGGEWITQKAHATEAEAVQDAQTWYPEQKGLSDPELKRPERQEEPFAAFLNIPAVITTIATPFQGRSAPWIVMNAPRPIRGHETQEGEFIHGRFFAAIDTSKEDAAAMIEENRKLDAKIVEGVDMETAIKIGLSQIPENYRKETEKMLADADKRDAALSMVLDKIPSDISHGKASELIQKARSMSSPLGTTGIDGTPPQPQSEPVFVVTLRDILAGKHDGDTASMGSLLDVAAEEAEKAGSMAQYETLFNQAADHLTATLKKRAA